MGPIAAVNRCATQNQSSLATCKALFSMTFYAALKVALLLAAGELPVRVQSFL